MRNEKLKLVDRYSCFLFVHLSVYKEKDNFNACCIDRSHVKQ
jgi:hypothetical protein